jgi:hypothetical protein
MHRRIAIDWALSSMMPKAVPDAPLGLRAMQWYADADVETVATTVSPTRVATKKLFIIALHDLSTSLSAQRRYRLHSKVERIIYQEHRGKL